MKVRFHGSVPVHVTEDPERVRRSVENLFSVKEFHLQSDGAMQCLLFEGEGLEGLIPLQTILQNDHIRNAVHKALGKLLVGNSIQFALNKQVAYVHHVSLCESSDESPLGAIEVEIECDEPHALLDWLAPLSPSPTQIKA